MTNLLRSAFAANKLFSTIARLRLLLVMFLTLTVSTEVWGAEVTFATSAYNGKGGASGTGGNATATIDGVTITSTKAYYTSAHIREYSGGTITVSSSSNITKIVFTSTASGTSDNGPSKISINSGGGNYSYSGSNGTWTGTSSTVKFNCNAQFRWKQVVVTTASSHTVTWTINPTEGGSLSTNSGNTTTVTPDAAYTYGSPAYTVTPAGKANVSQDGDNFTATPSANCTIQINMVEKAPANISFENMGNPTPTTTGYYVGDTYTLPETNDYTCGDKRFVGWSTEIIENSATKPTAATYFEPGASVTLAANQTFYAVFAEGSGEETLTSISGGDWSNGVTSNWTIYGTGTYSGNGVKFDGANDYVLSPDLSSKNYTKLLLKFKSGYNGNKGSVLTFYAYNKDKTLLMDENVTINPETVVPGDTYTNQNNIYEVSISASEIIGQVMIKMTSKTSNLGMKYCEVFGVSSSHSNYTTICTTETSDCSLLQFENNIAENYTATFAKNATVNALTVSAEYDGNSTGVTYQWYSNTTNSSTGGTSINDASSASYTPSTAEVGTTYYYCVATYDECTITSNVATIVVNPTYTVTFNSDGGSPVTAQTIEEGKTATKPTDPTKAGHTFIGWYNGDTEFYFTTPITSDITLKAKWIIKQYTVTLNPNYPDGKTGTFKDNGGNTVNGNLVQTYDYNTASMSLTDLYQSIELEGYQFNGWYSATSGGSIWTSTGIITKDVTVYAQWSKLHAVTFNTGTNNPTVAAMEGTSETGITLPAGPTPACSTDGWEFAGWWTESVAETTTSPGELLTAGSTYKPTSDCTLYAVYSYTEAGGGDSDVTFNFSNIATANSWTNGTAYTTVTISPITINAIGGGNNGKYYTSNTSWRMYNGGSLQISTDIGKITSVSSNPSKSFTINDEGTATLSFSATTEFKSITVSYSSSTTTYNSNPTCDICENILTINKGAETNGTFTLDKVGEQETCDGLSVLVTPTPAGHYHVASVTASTSETAVNNGDGTYTITYAANSTGESTINVTFEEDAKASITLSELGEPTTDNTTYYVGETYTLPSTSSQSCEGKQLVGWSRVEVAETDTKPTENYYELGAEVTLETAQTFYAVFAAGSGGGGETTANLSISDYATANSWVNATQYAIVNIDENITATATGGGNTGKYYTSGTNWRIYENEAPTLTITAKDGYTIKQIAITYDVDNSGILTFAGSNISSGTGCEINATSAVFGVGNTTSATNGQVRITKISVTYSGGGGYTAYTTSCVASYSITYDFAGGTSSHCSNTSVPQGDTYTICDDAPTKEGYTFQGWSDGTSTYAAGATFTPTGDVTLTAVWKANTYTVTWSNNGDPDEVTYNHGDALIVPAAPASCDGVKEFVGWTEDNTFTYHATTPPSDLFTEKTTTVTANATYYAVFATQGEGSANFVLGESGTFKMYANVEGTNYYAQGGVSNSKITSTTEAANASDYTLTHKGSNQYTIQLGNAYIGHSGTSSTDLNTTETTWTIKEGVNGSWRIVSPVNTSRALAYRASTYKIFKAYSMTSVEAGDTEYYDIEFGGISSGYSDYTTTCQQIESIEVQNPQTEFYLTDDFTIGSGKVIASLSGGGTNDVTALATFSGYNMNEVGTYTITVTYMGATATYEITVKPLDNAWVLTWNVSGKTNTGLGPRSVTKDSAIGTLPTPIVPDACEGKTFMGWTTSNIVNSDGTGITYITSETVPTDNTTYYAVFATVNNFSVQKPINDITDGSKVVIVAVASLDNTGSTGKAISSRTISITSKGVIGLAGDDVAIFDETINTPHSTCIWTIEKNGETVAFKQDSKYIRATDGGYRRLVLDATPDYWTLKSVEGKDKTYHMQSGNTNHFVEWFDHTDSKYDEGERYIGFVPYTEANDNGDFDMQFFVTANANGEADITDYTTGCTEYTITYYGFRGGYSTSTSSDGTIVLPVNSMHTVPDCGDVVKDHTNLGREFLNVWMTQPHGGHTFKPGDTFILTQDTTLYAQWKLETNSDLTTLPTDIEDLAGTDIYVYGGKTLNIQPGTTTINSLTLKGGIQADGSYKMPIVWVPEGATLVRNSNKIYLDLVVNAKNYYPFAVPFATKNDQYIDYLDPVLNKASTYGTHFVIKTYDGARRADVGEDRANNWVKVLRHATDKPSSLQPGVGYIIQALTYPDKDTATIRIPMTVPNTWFENGEQAVVGSTARNTIAVTAHRGAAATEHQRHAGWNFVASPYLTNFAGSNVENDGDLQYINGELTVNGGWQYGGDNVPYVTIPAYDFSYYTQHKLSDVKLSPEWSFFVQIGTSGTMDFSTAGRQEIPASIAARHDAAQSFKMDVDITLSDKNHSDQMGLIICDHFSSAYEVGYDLEKMFGSAYNLTVYTLMEDNTPLAYHALAIHSNMQVIPVGYRVPEQGDYTFALNQSTSSIDLLNEQYEQLILVDYETGALTNLLNSTYTFTSPRTQSDSRFAIYAVIRQKTPTDLPNIDDGDNSTRKILHNGHLYILRDGKVYNGNGQIVKQ